MNPFFMNRTSEKELKQQAELLDFLITNNPDAYHKKIGIFKKLWNFYRAGQFNVARATHAFSNLTDETARNYNKSGEGNIKISVMARRLQDTIFVSDFLGAAIGKEYDFMQ